ncbi:hypothetical protein BH24ACT3_BH24ACT3_14070 [soil metagenome]
MAPSLSPSDAEVALRSLPRRFRTVFAAAGDDGPDEPADPDDVAARVGPDGHSALDHLVHAARTIALLDRALEQLVDESSPTLHPAVADEAGRDWSDAPLRSVDDGLAELTAAAEAMAARFAGVAADDWQRSAPVAGGASGGTAVGALDVLGDAVGTAVARLKAAERTLREVRSRG